MPDRKVRKKAKEEKEYTLPFPTPSPENEASQTTENAITSKIDELRGKLAKIEKTCQEIGYTQKRRDRIESLKSLINELEQTIITEDRQANIASFKPKKQPYPKKDTNTPEQKKLAERPQESNFDVGKPRNDQPNDVAWIMSEFEDKPDETSPANNVAEKKWSEVVIKPEQKELASISYYEQMKALIDSASYEELEQTRIYIQKIKKEKFSQEKYSPSESYHQKITQTGTYWYKNYTENGKLKTKYVGSDLPEEVKRHPEKYSISYRGEKSQTSASRG